MGRIFSTLTILFLCLAAISVLLLSNQLFAQVTELFGKNPSLTGRDVIWSYIWDEIQKKFVLGYGFGTYWIMGTSVIDRFVTNVGWQVNEAHNGFLEIFLEVGIVGLMIFIILLLSFVKRIIKTDYKVALMALISILVVNFSESFIFQPRGPSTLVFMYFYLLVSQQLFYTETEESSSDVDTITT